MIKFKQIKIWLLIAVFVVANVYFTVEFATSGAEIASLEQKEAQLTEENSLLSGRLLETVSLDAIEKKAPELGFAKPVNIVYLNGNEPVAKLPFQGEP